MVSVIIVTIGAKDYIRSCLDSLLNQSYPVSEIIVIDNSPRPNSVRTIDAVYPSIRLFSCNGNLGYSAALNKGIELSRGEQVLCLNDDVVLGRDFIREALNGFSIHEKIGMVSGKVLRSSGRILDSTGLFLSIWRTAKERGYGKPDLGQFEKHGFIFGVTGAASFYRKTMLEEIKDRNGYFDSGFCMFYEDLDVAWRAHKKGWRAYYIPKAVAYHVRGGSFRPDPGIDKAVARRYLSDGLHYELIKNRYLTILKNDTFPGFLLHIIPILIYDLFSWAYILFFRPKVIKLFFSKLKDR